MSDFWQNVQNDATGDVTGMAVEGAVRVLVYGWASVSPSISALYGSSNRAKQASGDNNITSVKLNYRVDEVFVVLARLGERLLALDVFDIDVLNTARETLLVELKTEEYADVLEQLLALDAALQYLITGALYFCSACHPMHMYRGFGAGVWDDYAWGCPDPGLLPAAKKHMFHKDEPAPEVTVLPIFDAIIASLKSHAVRDSLLKDYPRGISRTMPDFSTLDAKNSDVKDKLKILKDFTSTLEKRGFPVPSDGSLAHVSRWQIPRSTWRSAFACKDQEDHAWLDVTTQQMDPGKIFYAFTCEHHLDLIDDEVLVLPPASPAEQLGIWLEGKAGTNHRILRWEDLDTTLVEKHFGRTTKKYVGRDPLPNRFAFRDPTAHHKNALYRMQSDAGMSPDTTAGSSSRPALPMVPTSGHASSGSQPTAYAADYMASKPPGGAISQSPGAVHPIYGTTGTYGSPLMSPDPSAGVQSEDAVVNTTEGDSKPEEDNEGGDENETEEDTDASGRVQDTTEAVSKMSVAHD